jgi:hypothetical protein
MTEPTLPIVAEALTPGTPQRQRMARAVYAGVEAEQASLISEWLTMIRARPLLHGVYVLAAVALLIWMSPIAALPLQLLRMQGG